MVYIKVNYIFIYKVEGYIKLTDFGMARRLRSPDERVNSFCGTPEYLSPEMLHHNGYGLECDIWVCILIYSSLI